MRITIVGAGKVGYSVAQYLSREDHDVVVIEAQEERRNIVQNNLDVMVIEGNGASPAVLNNPNVKESDLFISVTDNDEVNMVACRVAKDAGIGFTIARIRNDDYFSAAARDNRFFEVMGVDIAINTDFVTAQEISRILQTPSALDVEDFAGGKIRLLETRLQSDSPLINTRLKDISLPENVLVAGILRRDQMIIPNGDDILQISDNAFFIGRPESLELLAGNRLQKLSRVENVLIIGAGRTGRYLALFLESKGVMVKVIDSQESRCKEMAKHLKRGKVFLGRGIDMELLSQEGVGQADAVICLTHDDELNLMLALIAKDCGAQRTFVRVGHPEYIPLMQKVGVDVVLSPRLTTAEVIMRQVHRGKFTMLALLEGAKASALEIAVSPNSKVLGRKLKDVKFPKNCLVGAILRRDQVIVPNGESVLQQNDNVVMFALPEMINKIEKFF